MDWKPYKTLPEFGMTSEADCVIDCRTDVLTQPCDDMKAEMMKATSGLDCYNESLDTIGKFTVFCAIIIFKVFYCTWICRIRRVYGWAIRQRSCLICANHNNGQLDIKWAWNKVDKCRKKCKLCLIFLAHCSHGDDVTRQKLGGCRGREESYFTARVWRHFKCTLKFSNLLLITRVVLYVFPH